MSPNRSCSLHAFDQRSSGSSGPVSKDAAKVHEMLRDLVRVFEELTENAQAFMAAVARSIELQQAQA